MTFDKFYASLVAQNNGTEDGLNQVQLMAAFNAGFDRGYYNGHKTGIRQSKEISELFDMPDE